MRPTREDFPVVYTMSTRWNDNDHYGHMNNATYFEYIDTAVNGWLMQATGGDIRDLPAIGIVASTGCDYYAELGFPDVLEIGLATSRIGNSSISYIFSSSFFFNSFKCNFKPSAKKRSRET